MIAKDITEYELVVGLEVHIQLNTESKAFTRDLNHFGDEPNSNISAITLAHPGTLPRMNQKHLEKAIILALATKAEVNLRNQFDRKNYFYPDLPKGYQITQDRHPICIGGEIEFETEQVSKKIRLHHTHMEEDAGKSSHDGSQAHSLLDYNRAGTPLLEMVTEPDLRSAQEVHDFMATVQKLVRYLGISDGNMEEGSMRCDCNVSIRLKGDSEYGERCEIKNVNSKKFAKQAVDYEFKRQFKMLQEGEVITKQTLNFNPETGRTTPLRSKEDAHDYRYFPDPDLPPIVLTTQYIDKLRSKMPMLPKEYESLLIEKYKLSAYAAKELTRDKEFADFFMRLAEKESDFSLLANVVINKILPLSSDYKLSVVSKKLLPDLRLLEFIKLIKEDQVTTSAANQRLFPAMLENPNEQLRSIAERLKILKSSDQSFLDAVIEDVLSSNVAELEKFKKGNKALFGFFMGQVMRQAKGKADPKVLKTLLSKKLQD